MISSREASIFAASISFSAVLFSNYASWSKYSFLCLGSLCLLYLFFKEKKKDGY